MVAPPVNVHSMASDGHIQSIQSSKSCDSLTAEPHSPATPQQSQTDSLGPVKRGRLSAGGGFGSSVAPQQRLLHLNSVILTSRTMTVAVDGPDSTVTSTTTIATSGTASSPYLVHSSSNQLAPCPRPTRPHLSHSMRMAGALHDAPPPLVVTSGHEYTANCKTPPRKGTLNCTDKSYAQSVSGYNMYGTLSGHVPSTSTSQLSVSIHDSSLGPSSGSAGESPVSSSLGPPSARSVTSVDLSDMPARRPGPSIVAAVVPEVRLMQLRRKASSIRNRLSNVELAQTEYHTAGELQSLVSGCNRRMVVPRSRTDDTDESNRKKRANCPKAEELYALEEKLEVLLKNTHFKRNFFRKEELKSKSAAELVRLIKKYEPKRLHELLSPAALRFLLQPLKRRPLNLAVDEADNLNASANALNSHLHSLQHQYDSEATDSSSGGEDDEEWVTAKSRPKKYGLPRAEDGCDRIFTCEREEYTWLGQRSDLGRQWVWLQSQVGDVEYKIRQHVDIYGQLRSRPPPVQFKDQDTGTCSRVRPLQLNTKRKIVNTAGMFRWNRKTSRLSTVACGCSPPLGPCVLCSGRVNNTDNIPDMCSQSLAYRVSLVHPSYNPVLTSRTNLAFDRRLQAYLKTQASVSHAPAKRSKTKLKEEKGRPSLTTSAPKKCKVAPLRIKVPKESTDSSKPSPVLNSGRQKKKITNSWNGSVSSSRATSPHSPCASDVTSKTPGKVWTRRSTAYPSSFDIDNIFIDPSVAAVSRVEKIPYKEIDTPKWREVSVQLESDVASSSDLDISGVESEIECLADDSFVKRHLFKELEERKRFQVYKDIVNGSSLGSRRGSHSSLSDSAQFMGHKTQPPPPKSVSHPLLELGR